MSQKLYLTGGKLPGRFPEVDIIEITHRPCVIDPVEKIQEFAADIEFTCFPKERQGTEGERLAAPTGLRLHSRDRSRYYGQDYPPVPSGEPETRKLGTKPER
jgi:hypothetical protein